MGPLNGSFPTQFNYHFPYWIYVNNKKFFFLFMSRFLPFTIFFASFNHVPFYASFLPLLRFVSGLFSSIMLFIYQPVRTVLFCYTPVCCRFFFSCFLNSLLRHWNTGLVSSRVSLTSWGEGASLALVGHPSSDGITITIS